MENPIKNKMEFNIKGILVNIGFLLNIFVRFFLNIFFINLMIKNKQEVVNIKTMKKIIKIRIYDDNCIGK